MADATLDFEVFAPGKYHHFPAFTASDLDQMVANFEALRGYIKPPLKAGHSTNQLLAGQTDGDPALGWCTALKRVGNKLVGTFAGVPEKFAALIRKGRYLRGSSEIVMDWAKCADEANLKTGVAGKVFTGFAVLGADVPAVKNLDDLADFLGATGPLAFSEPTTDTTNTATVQAALKSYADGSLRDFDSEVCDAVCERFGGMDGCSAYVRDLFPDRVIVETSDGLLSCPITRNAEGEIELGEPTTVAIAYTPTGNAMEASGSHARVDLSAATAAQENDMADEPKNDDGAALAKLTDLEAQFSAMKAELAEKNAKIDALAKESQEARAREIAAESRARHAEAVEWVKTFSDQSNLRILPAQRGWATVLRDRLVALDATIAPSELTGCFSEGETPVELSLADVFERFVQALPDQKAMLTETTVATTPQVDDIENYITLKAKESGRNAKDPVVRAELSRLYIAERSH